MPQAVIIIFLIFLSFSSFAQDTILKLYRPFGDAEQQIPLIIKEKIAGQCWQQSKRIQREDAWRCVAEGHVYDPCFVKEYGSHKEARCPHSPWSAEAVEIELASATDNSQHLSLDMSTVYPWAIELATGERCLAIDEGEIYDGLQVRYYCNNQISLIGHLQRCKARWSILQHTPAGVATVMVNKAWF